MIPRHGWFLDIVLPLSGSILAIGIQTWSLSLCGNLAMDIARRTLGQHPESVTARLTVINVAGYASAAALVLALGAFIFSAARSRLWAPYPSWCRIAIPSLFAAALLYGMVLV